MIQCIPSDNPIGYPVKDDTRLYQSIQIHIQESMETSGLRNKHTIHMTITNDIYHAYSHSVVSPVHVL